MRIPLLSVYVSLFPPQSAKLFLRRFQIQFISRGLRALDKLSHSDPICVLYTKVREIQN